MWNDLQQTEHGTIPNRASESGRNWTRRFDTKTSVFCVFMCHRSNRCQSIVFSDGETYFGKVDNRQWYFKVNNRVCKHAWFSKQMGAVVWKASSVVCRSLFGKHLYLIVCSVRDRLKVWHGDKSSARYRRTQNWISFLTLGPILISCGPHPLLTYYEVKSNIIFGYLVSHILHNMHKHPITNHWNKAIIDIVMICQQHKWLNN